MSLVGWMVPVEHFLLFSEVHTAMLAWLRPTVALTSQFFLSDVGEDMEVPLSVPTGPTDKGIFR